MSLFDLDAWNRYEANAQRVLAKLAPPQLAAIETPPTIVQPATGGGDGAGTQIKLMQIAALETGPIRLSVRDVDAAGNPTGSTQTAKVITLAFLGTSWPTRYIPFVRPGQNHLFATLGDGSIYLLNVITAGCQ
jgi:hypothetical protein